MGGTKDAATGGCANGIAIHARCHSKVERDRSEALKNGWLVPQNIDPATVPIKLWDGWALLGEDGSLRRTDPHDLTDPPAVDEEQS